MPLQTKVHAAASADPMAPGAAGSADLDRLAADLERRGLAAPAALLLDAHRPLLPLLRQASIFLGPFLAPIARARLLRGVRMAFDEPDLYDRLTDRLAGGRR
jgi:hypothetical protein